MKRETNQQLLLTAKCSLVLHHPARLFRHEHIIIMASISDIDLKAVDTFLNLI